MAFTYLTSWWYGDSTPKTTTSKIKEGISWVKDQMIDAVGKGVFLFQAYCFSETTQELLLPFLSKEFHPPFAFFVFGFYKGLLPGVVNNVSDSVHDESLDATVKKAKPTYKAYQLRRQPYKISLRNIADETTLALLSSFSSLGGSWLVQTPRLPLHTLDPDVKKTIVYSVGAVGGKALKFGLKALFSCCFPCCKKTQDPSIKNASLPQTPNRFWRSGIGGVLDMLPWMYSAFCTAKVVAEVIPGGNNLLFSLFTVLSFFSKEYRRLEWQQTLKWAFIDSLGGVFFGGICTPLAFNFFSPGSASDPITGLAESISVKATIAAVSLLGMLSAEAIVVEETEAIRKRYPRIGNFFCGKETPPPPVMSMGASTRYSLLS